MNEQSLRVGGITPFTTIDYPGKLAAVIFCQGCPWHCQYCYNTDLIPATASRLHAWEDIKQLLMQRKGLLDAVVFSGGEPSFQHSLLSAIHDVKEMQFAVGLHTNGAYPKKLKRLLPSVDWVGFDIKTVPEQYSKLTGAPHSGDKVWQSLEVLLKADVSFECRTTVHTKLLTTENILSLARELSARGVSHYVLQACQTEKCFNKELSPSSLNDILNKTVLAELHQLFPSFQIRGIEEN